MKGAIGRGEMTVALRQVLPQHRKLFIEGQPGAGKTTFLKLVASCLARDVLGVECPEGVPWRKHHLGLKDRALPTPIFLRVADLVAILIANNRPGCPDDRSWFIDLLVTRCKENKTFPSRDYWIDQLERGKAMLLVDGLDESGDERIRGRVLNILRDACDHWGESRIIVSSRPIQAQILEEMGFHHTVIEPFGDGEITRFIAQWIAALYGLNPEDKLDAEGSEYKNSLLSAIVGLPRIRRIATNPVMLTCLCVVHWNEGRLPEGRARVYKAVIRWLIASRTELRNEAEFTDRFAELAFARLALHMMEAAGKQATIDLQDAAEAIEPVLERELPDATRPERLEKARAWMHFEAEWSGIVEEITEHRFRFWHLTFQEYLAALQMARCGDERDRSDEDSWPMVKAHLEDRQWSETIDMVPACLFDDGGEGRVDRFFERLLDQYVFDTNLPAIKRLVAWVGRLTTATTRLLGFSISKNDLQFEARIVVLMGRFLVSMNSMGYKGAPHIIAKYKTARERTMAIFSLEGSRRVPEKIRIAAAEALGRAGDPRLDGIENPEEIEKFYLQVPALDKARLGKYLVTVKEFLIFHQNGGYDEQKYWDEVGWKIRHEEGWEAPGDWEVQLEIPNKPVVEVSWYEASAYCRWLTACLHEKEITARLPTQKEWEATARRTRGDYPWGEEKPNPELANYNRENSPGKPTPVGLYPAGAGPQGHLDLAGNVWEWSADEYPWNKGLDRFLKDSLSRKRHRGETARFLRGGCYWSDAECLRVSGRDWYPARRRFHNVGFRVLLCPANTLT